MILAKGSTVTINSQGVDIQGALSEDVTIALKSNFRALAADFQNELTQVVDILGATAKSLTGGGVGFSSQFKQMTTQVWDKTDPARFNINVDFHRTPLNKNTGPQNVSGKNLMNIIKTFCAIPLPAESKDIPGMLIPPGPSPIEGIGLDRMVNGGEQGAKTDTYVNVTIGNINFNRLLLESAEPTFSKYTDDSNYPINCRVAFTFVSMWAATKKMIQDW